MVNNIDRDLTKLLWRNKKPRLSYKTLQLPKDEGGLALPNIMHYNWSCHSRIIHEWIRVYLEGKDNPLESWACAPFSFASELMRKKNTHSNFLVDNTIKV